MRTVIIEEDMSGRTVTSRVKLITKEGRTLLNDGSLTILVDYDSEMTTVYVLPPDFSNLDASYEELEEKKIAKIVL